MEGPRTLEFVLHDKSIATAMRSPRHHDEQTPPSITRSEAHAQLKTQHAKNLKINE